MSIPSKKNIGIIGGGQLGKMLLEAASPWNANIEVLENNSDCPAAHLASTFVPGDIKNKEDVLAFGKNKDCLTYEIEHISIEAIEELEAQGVEVIPKPAVLRTIHNKAVQKDFYHQHNCPTLPYCVPKNSAEYLDFIHAQRTDNIVVKSRTGGYDGKGVQILPKEEAIKLADDFDQLLLEQMAEDMVEYSVIVSVGNNEIKSFPLVEMYFNPQSNLVEFLFSPTRASTDLEKSCKSIAENVVSKFNSKGLFAVELIVTKEGEIYINEIAPRPHNSGHHTIEGSYTSQFEQLNRILLGLPLGNTDMIKPTAMINLVGGENQFGEYQLKHAKELLAMEGVYIHLYNKKDIKPNRKMGHINVMADTLEELLEKAGQVQKRTEFQSTNV